MGEWSEYFEDFPEEDPGNYVNGKFDPVLARTVRQQEQSNSAAKEEVNRLLLKAWLKEKEKHYLTIEECPQCGLEELKVYSFNEYYLCECQDCGIYGKGKTKGDALKAVIDAFGDGLDWRDVAGPWSC